MLEIKELTHYYEEAAQPALKNVSFSVERGEMLAIVGHNGSGKSTLAKHLNGLLLPSGGDVLIDGLNTKDEEALIEIRRRVGMVFQNPDNQLVTSIVEEDVAFGPENLGVPPAEIRRRVDEALSLVGMTASAKRAGHALSGGQKQRIAIAGMLAMQPEVLVLDEATAMLDPAGRDDVLSVVRELNRTKKITVVMITQYMEEVIGFDRVIVMDHGKITMTGTPKEIFARADELREIGLDVPETVALTEKLRRMGFSIEGTPVTTEETVQAICRSLSIN